MDPKTPTAQELLPTIAQHENSVRRHEMALAQQEELMAKHSQLLADVTSSIRQLFDRLPPTPLAPPAMSSTALPSPQPPISMMEPRLPPPQRYTGDPNACRGFLTQCSLSFELQPSSFPSDRSKVAYLITLLSGKALAWATEVWGAQSPCCSSYSAFEMEFKKVFDHPIRGREASKRLLTLQQDGRSAADYAIQFRTMAAGSGWNEESLMVCFQNGLSEALQDELVTRDPAISLESLIDLAVRLDNRLRERKSNHRPFTPVTLPSSLGSLPQSPDIPEPMNLGGSRISPFERDRRMRERCCLYCGLPGHFRSTCPELSGNARSRTGREGL